MSIIIAKTEGDQCIICSDTKVSIDNGDLSVTGDGKVRLPITDGVLKTHIVAPKINISYAGDVRTATKIVHKLISEKPINILEFIKNELIKNNNDVDFIVAYHLDKNPQLYKITKDNIQKGDSFWIGDIFAFSEFQSYYNSPENTIKNFNDRFYDSFTELINQTGINTIGNFSISVSFRKEYDYFIYDRKLESYNELHKISLKKGERLLMDEGAPQLGSYMVSNLISKDPNNQAVALFFNHANFGILYIAMSEKWNTSKGISFSNNNLEKFISKVLEQYNIKLTGISFNNGAIKSF